MFLIKIFSSTENYEYELEDFEIKTIAYDENEIGETNLTARFYDKTIDDFTFLIEKTDISKIEIYLLSTNEKLYETENIVLLKEIKTYFEMATKHMATAVYFRKK